MREMSEVWGWDGGVLLAVRTPLASHPLAGLREVPTQLAGYCLHLELPMVTQTLHVFSVYSPPVGTQSNAAVRGHLISYLDTAMEASHNHPCLLAGDFNHDARCILLPPVPLRCRPLLSGGACDL